MFGQADAFRNSPQVSSSEVLLLDCCCQLPLRHGDKKALNRGVLAGAGGFGSSYTGLASMFVFVRVVCAYLRLSGGPWS